MNTIVAGFSEYGINGGWIWWMTGTKVEAGFRYSYSLASGNAESEAQAREAAGSVRRLMELP